MSNERKLANPAAVGLAGFGGTTSLLQFHNLGWCGSSPVLWTALFFGGIMQLMAGDLPLKNQSRSNVRVKTEKGG